MEAPSNHFRMHIGLAGPVDPRLLGDLLNPLPRGRPLPEGLKGPNLAVLARAFIDKGHSVSIFTLDKRLQSPVTLPGDQLQVLLGPYRPSGRGRDFFRQEREHLRRAMEAVRPDLVHAHWTYEFAMAALDTGLPTLVTAHDAPLRILTLMPDTYRLVRALMAVQVSRRAHHLTAISPHIARHYRRFLRYPRDIRIIPNGFQDALFELGARRQRPGAPAGPAVFAAVINGGWNPIKNPENLLRAFRKTRDDGNAFRLRMFGSGWGRNEDGWRNAVRRSLDEGVVFEGALPWNKLLEAMADGVDILVHPSREEGLSNAIVEAQALSIPVIGGATSGAVPYLLGDGQAGVLVDIMSPAAIAAEMIALAEDPERRQALAESGHTYARSHFHIDQVTDSYLDCYDQMLAGSA